MVSLGMLVVRSSSICTLATPNSILAAIMIEKNDLAISTPDSPFLVEAVDGMRLGSTCPFLFEKTLFLPRGGFCLRRSRHGRNAAESSNVAAVFDETPAHPLKSEC